MLNIFFTCVCVGGQGGGVRERGQEGGYTGVSYSKMDRIALLLHSTFYRENTLLPLVFNPVALRTAKTLWSFGRSECNRVRGPKSR